MCVYVWGGGACEHVCTYGWSRGACGHVCVWWGEGGPVGMRVCVVGGGGGPVGMFVWWGEGGSVSMCVWWGEGGPVGLCVWWGEGGPVGLCVCVVGGRGRGACWQRLAPAYKGSGMSLQLYFDRARRVASASSSLTHAVTSSCNQRGGGTSGVTSGVAKQNQLLPKQIY